MPAHLLDLGLLAATLAAYQLGLWLHRRAGRSLWLHPLVIGASSLALFISLTDVSYLRYQAATDFFYNLLGLATVALAIPLHREFHHIKHYVLPVLASVCLGSFAACAIAVGLASLAGGSQALLLAVAPKSVTTPIALGIAESLGANASLATGTVIFTGVVGALLAPLAFTLSGLTDPRAQGLVLGINAHGIGIAQGFEINRTTGVFASLAMGLTGAFTALWLPALVNFWLF